MVLHITKASYDGINHFNPLRIVGSSPLQEGVMDGVRRLRLIHFKYLIKLHELSKEGKKGRQWEFCTPVVQEHVQLTASWRRNLGFQTECMEYIFLSMNYSLLHLPQ